MVGEIGYLPGVGDATDEREDLVEFDGVVQLFDCEPYVSVGRCHALQLARLQAPSVAEPCAPYQI